MDVDDRLGGPNMPDMVDSVVLYNKLHALHSAGLSDSVDIFVTFCQQKLSQLPIYHKFLALQAEALHELKQYEKAELIFKKALQFNKCSLRNHQSRFEYKSESTSNSANHEIIGSDVDTGCSNERIDKPDLTTSPMLGADFYFNLAKTQIARNNYSAAMQSLLTIPVESRSLKVQVLILQVMTKQNAGNLANSTSRMEAVTDLLDFLKQWPIALSIIITYLRELAPINADLVKELCFVIEKALIDQKLNSVYTGWVINWVKLQAMDFMVPNERYLTQLQQITTNIQSSIGATPAMLLATIAICQYNVGQYEHARANFAEARRKDPYILTGMTKYCHLLFLVKNSHMLDVVATKLHSIAPESVEALIALAYYCLSVAYSNKSEQSNTAQKVSRVLYIAHKALLADSRCIEALLLKASALCSKEVNRPNEALDHYKEAQKWRSWCFEAYSDHVKLLLSGFSMRTPISKEMKEMSGGGTIHNPALVTAFQSIKKCGKSARTLTLLAKAFRNEPLASKDKATATIDKALELDPKYTPAIILKADLLLAETKKPPLSQPSSSSGPNEAAINFLKTKLDTFPESAIVIHEKLASIYATLDQKDDELIHRNVVMSLSRMPHDGSDVAGTGFGSLSCRIEDDFQPLDSVGTSYGNFSMDMDTSIGLSGRNMAGGTGNGWHAVGMTGTTANDSDLSFD